MPVKPFYGQFGVRIVEKTPLISPTWSAPMKGSTVPTPEAPQVVAEPTDVDQDLDSHRNLVEADSLVEEVSIDGMCGVY